MMKVKYIGPNIGVTGLIDGNVYEVSEVDMVIGALRVVGEDQSDWNYDNDQNWKPGYLYSPTKPRPIAIPEQEPGKFFIVEDENNQLKDIGVLPMPQYHVSLSKSQIGEIFVQRVSTMTLMNKAIVVIPIQKTTLKMQKA